MVVGTVTFSAIRSNPHSGVCSIYIVRSRYAVPVGMEYAVGTQYVVGMQYRVGTQYVVGMQ